MLIPEAANLAVVLDAQAEMSPARTDLLADVSGPAGKQPAGDWGREFLQIFEHWRAAGVQRKPQGPQGMVKGRQVGQVSGLGLDPPQRAVAARRAVEA